MSNSGSKSNANITKLGIQLGILSALERPSSPKTSGPKSHQEASDRDQAAQVIRKRKQRAHAVRIENISGELETIKTRLRLLASPKRAAAADVPSATRKKKEQVVGSPTKDARTEGGSLNMPSLSRTASNRHGPFIDPHRYSTYQLRVDFWSELELRRMKPHLLTSDPILYGHEPSFLILNVPGCSTPAQLLQAILYHWRWDGNHRFRFSGAIDNGIKTKDHDVARIATRLMAGRCHGKASESASGDDSKSPVVVYEGKAFTQCAGSGLLLQELGESETHEKSPCLSEFGINFGSKCIMEYDIVQGGDHWRWECTCLDILQPAKCETNPKAELITRSVQEVGIQLLNMEGSTPIQYKWQFEDKYGDSKTAEKPPATTETAESGGWRGGWRGVMAARYVRKSMETNAAYAHQHRLEASDDASVFLR